MKEYIRIDKNGYAVFKNIDLPFNQRGLDIVSLNDEENIPDGYILAYEGGGFYHPKWTRVQWTEGLSQDEIDELYKLPEKEPSEIEIVGQEITMLKLSNIAKDNTINTLGQELTNIKLQLQEGI